jgi:hypothetical protein
MTYHKVVFSIIISFLIIFISCKKESSINNENIQTEQNTNIITKTDIKNIKYIEYVLSNQSKKVTNNWVKFQELKNNVEVLKKGDLSFFKDDSVLLKAFIEDLKNEIPQNLNIPEITTRITVLQNCFYNLHNEISLNRNTKTYVIKSIKEALISVSNLYLQINKKLELDSQNVQKPQ